MLVRHVIDVKAHQVIPQAGEGMIRWRECLCWRGWLSLTQAGEGLGEGNSAPHYNE
jgi:hypothetical protein